MFTIHTPSSIKSNASRVKDTVQDRVKSYSLAKLLLMYENYQWQPLCRRAVVCLRNADAEAQNIFGSADWQQINRSWKAVEDMDSCRCYSFN